MPRVEESLPPQQLNPRIKTVWRLSDLLWIVIVCVSCIAPFAIVRTQVDEGWLDIVLIVECAIFAALLIIFEIVLPPIRFARWRYGITADYLDIARGIFWRKRFIIPFIRVQNTDTRQGPILRALGLSSVTVATAAGEHEIPGIESHEAALLRDRAAELARLAREDV